MEKLFIIKIGGNIIDDEEKLSVFLQEFASIQEKKVLVHGGGKLATKVAEQLNIPQQMIEGRRITDSETLKVVTMVYGGWINKKIVSVLQSNGVNAIGLTGADADLVRSHKRRNAEFDYGFAGDVDDINVLALRSLLEMKLTPVVAPITHDGKGQLLNTNADTIAQELATAASKEFEVHLFYSFEKKGVLLDMEDEESVIPELNASFYNQLRQQEKIFAGMIPKLDNAFSALASGVKRIVIGNAESLKELVKGTAGTTIKNDGEHFF